MKRLAAVAALGSALVLGLPPPSLVGQEPQRTEIALVIRISTPPLFDTRARPAADAKRRLAALARSLAGLTSALASDIPLAIAASPVLCDELAILGSAEAKSVRSAIRRLATNSTVMVSPYADARIAGLTSDEIASQLADGRRALTRCTAARPSTYLLPPDLSLDSDAVRESRRRGIKVALSDRVREPVVTDSIDLLPSRLSTEAQPIDVLASVGDLAAAVVVLDAGRSDLAKLVTSMGQQPGLVLRSLKELRDDPRAGFVAFDTPGDPPRSYRLAVAGAENAVARLRSFTLGGNKLAAILGTSLARARGSAEWNDRWRVGRDRARAIVRSVRNQRRLLSVAQGSVTFTSRRGSIPVTIASRATYPVRVRITVSSPKLDFPTGASRVVVVKPPGDTVQFQALARSTGTFPMRVELQSPDRRIDFDSGQIDVRSTAANVPALVLTAGGALFLIVWYGRRRVRRRGNPERP